MKKPHIVMIKFLDHTAGDGNSLGSIECVVCGILVGEDSNCYYIASWITSSGLDHNSETFSILKSTVKKMKRIKNVEVYTLSESSS